MKRPFSFEEKWERSEREFKGFQRVVIGIIVCIALFIILSWVLTGFIAFKFIDNPEVIGDWFNRLISGLEGEK